MPYDIKNLSKEALQKIFIVLKDIDLYSELRNRDRFLFIRTNRKSKYVTKTEHKAIIEELIYDKIIKESRVSFIFFPDIFLIHIGNPFFDFYDKVRLELNKKDKPNIKIIPDRLSYNSDKSVLHFSGYKIFIAKKNEKPNAHYILEHIFTAEDSLNQEYCYSEIAEDTFEENYDKWRKYYRACEDINQKVGTVTGIYDFLIYKTGRKGWVKINEKYLK